MSPYVGVIQFVAARLTGKKRFAAKEACRKACTHLHDHSRGFQRIMILPVAAKDTNEFQSVRPQGLILDQDYTADVVNTKETSGVGGEAQESSPLVDVNELDGQLCEISISHDNEYATAVAIVPCGLCR